MENGGLLVQAQLHRLILLIWESQTTPADFKDALIVPIFKKGDRSLCGNYKGISLLSIAAKVLSSILLTRLNTLVEEIFPVSQCGFR